MLTDLRRRGLISDNGAFQKTFSSKQRCILFLYFSVFEGFSVYLGEAYVNYVIRSRPQTASDILECRVYFKGGYTSPSPDEANFFFIEKNKVIRFSFSEKKIIFRLNLVGHISLLSKSLAIITTLWKM